MDRLHRLRLLLGNHALDKLRESTVMVVGCGAVGSFAIEALARSGIGHLILIDSDRIEESNINRQLFALVSTVGKDKVEVAKERVKDINPDIQVDAIKIFFDDKTELSFLPDFVIDAIDTVESKIALYKWCESKSIKFISSMGAALKMDSSKIIIDKISRTKVCPLAKKIRGQVKEQGIKDFPVVYSTEPAKKTTQAGHILGSMISVTGSFGLYMAEYAIKTLTSNI